MKVECWFIGKTTPPYLEEGVQVFQQRLRHYLPFQVELIPDIKQAGKLGPDQLKDKEAAAILQRLRPEDWLVLLDERGKEFTSEQFAKYLEQQLGQSHRRLIFLVGGAYGFAPALYERANAKMALSRLTFSHQMVRLFFLEQLYRAMSILRNEPYHNT